MKPTAISFRFALTAQERGASAAAGDAMVRADGGWDVTFAETARRVWVPDTNVLEVQLG